MDTHSKVELLAEARDAGPSGRGRRIREQARISQVELSAALDVSHTAVSLWESAQRSPRGDHAIRYAQLLRHLEKTNGRPATTPDARKDRPRGGRHESE